VRAEEAVVRSVVGALPPPSPRRPGRPRLRRRIRHRASRPQGGDLSARQFAVIAFVVWAGLLAVLDFTMGRLRHPGELLVQPIGRPEPPPAILPDNADLRRTTPPAPRMRNGRTTLPAARGPVTPATIALGSMIIPVVGVASEDLRDSFAEPRSGGRRHEAIDILAPRNTPILAAEDGTIVKLYESKAGGLTIYELEPSGNYELYYAHLESYAPGVHEGDAVRQGQVIGYVGTSGNAPKDVPHLHFSVIALGAERSWWKGTAVNPYPLLMRRSARVVTAASR